MATMYCPRCRAEYRPGYTVCADCQEALVDELPPERTIEDAALPDLVVVYEASHPQAELVRSVLEGSGITAAVKTGQTAAYPLTVGDIGRGQVLVRRSDHHRAREVIDAALHGELGMQDSD